MSFVRSEATGTGLKPHHHRVPSGIRGRPTSAQSAKNAKKLPKSASTKTRGRSSSRASDPLARGGKRTPSVTSENRRPSWNDTWNTDFDEFKLSPRELQARKEAFKSKHLDAVRLDEEEKAIARAARSLKDTPKNTGKPRAGILQEVLCNEKEFRQFLGDGGVVRDLFGSPIGVANSGDGNSSHPRRFCGVASFTQAPSTVSDGASNDLKTRPLNLNSQPTLTSSNLIEKDDKLVEARDDIGRESPSCLNRTDLTQDSATEAAERPLSADDEEGGGGGRFEAGLDVNRFQRVLRDVETADKIERENKEKVEREKIEREERERRRKEQEKSEAKSNEERERMEKLKEKEELATKLRTCITQSDDTGGDGCRNECRNRTRELASRVQQLEATLKAKDKENVDLKSMIDLLTNDVLGIRQELAEMKDGYEQKFKNQEATAEKLQEKLAKFGQILDLSTRNSDLETSLLPSLLNASQVLVQPS